MCVFVLDRIRVLNSTPGVRKQTNQVHLGIEVSLLHQQFDERKKEVSPLLALKEQRTCITSDTLLMRKT